MTISGRPEIAPRQQKEPFFDFQKTMAAHCFDVLITSIDPKMVQILTEMFKTISKLIDYIKLGIGKFISTI